ncbi:ly6/PLAUR domain-containing protein 5 [Heterocephalus glaber]|uniref:Ly6/PLAUR domain-containing protein 5 n=1 Tax=Heterocephalus glaber TaxID=10181 RepID=A0AAX6QQW0_HETGA|nr:ly6/PLAUR domain-containing protein 5 [Heterocephalus glaber]
MGSPRDILLCLFGTVLLFLTGSRALQCYRMEHIYFGHFDLSAMQLPNVSCPHGCSEVVMSLDTGYRTPLTVVQKGCWEGPMTGQMQEHPEALPPDYSVVRGCAADFCNSRLQTHDSLPDLSRAPSPQTLSGTECYVCLGVHPEDCSVEKSRRVQCHRDQSVCYQGNGRMNTGNFSVPVYIRTCHRPSCIAMGTSSPWTAIDLNGSCCQGSLCNGRSLNFNAAPAAAPPRAPHALALLLTTAALASALGGPLGLSA